MLIQIDVIGNFQNAYTFARKAIFEFFDNRKNVVVIYATSVARGSRNMDAMFLELSSHTSRVRLKV